MSPQGKPYDASEIKEMYQGAEESLREVFMIFLSDSLEQRRRLEEALERGDSASGIKAAHSLANLLGAIRNKEGAAQARLCERELRAGDLFKAREESVELLTEVEHSRKVVEEEL